MLVKKSNTIKKKFAHKPSREDKQIVSSLFVKPERRHKNNYISKIMFDQEMKSITLKKTY